jgi:hypothetical protein
MKNIQKVFLCSLCFFTVLWMSACSNDGDIKELKLSTSEFTVMTDSTEYDFDIVSGNGNYKVNVNNDSDMPLIGEATVTGNHVKVSLVSERTKVTVTDGAGQTMDLLIISQNKSLNPIAQDIAVEYGDYIISQLNWGNGGYYILSQQGDAAQVMVDKGQVIVKSVHPGDISFVIADRRGTTNSFHVGVGSGFDIKGKELTVSTSVKAGYITFPIKYGVGGWQITSCSEVLNKPTTCICPQIANYREQDMLQIWIPKDAKGSLNLQMQDKVKNTVKLTVNLED